MLRSRNLIIPTGVEGWLRAVGRDAPRLQRRRPSLGYARAQASARRAGEGCRLPRLLPSRHADHFQLYSRRQSSAYHGLERTTGCREARAPHEGRASTVAAVDRDEGRGRAGEALCDRHHHRAVPESLRCAHVLERLGLFCRWYGGGLHDDRRGLARARARYRPKERPLEALRDGSAPTPRCADHRWPTLRAGPRSGHAPA